MNLDVYINGQYRITIDERNEENVRIVCNGMQVTPTFMPQGVTPEQVAEKLKQSVPSKAKGVGK